MLTFCLVACATFSVVFLIKAMWQNICIESSLSTFCRIKPISLFFLHVLHVIQKNLPENSD